jgi:threonine/homoserine/homoserine lactone efflux protein
MDASYLAYLSLTAGLVITPGATTAVVVRNALDAGWRGGLATAVGAALGNSTHAVLAGAGVAVALARSPRVFVVVQVVGALYLLWLGFSSIRRVVTGHAVPMASTLVAARATASPHHAVREGLTVNLLNPSIATFYLVVVPSFVRPSSPGWYAGLAATHVGLAFLTHATWSIALDRLRHVLASAPARLVLEAVTGVALITLALRIGLGVAGR